MTDGNAHFLRWFHLRRACMALVYSALISSVASVAMGQSVNVSKEGAYAKLSVTSISQTPAQAALNQFAISLSYVVKSGPVGSSASASAAIPGFVGANTTTHNQSKSGSLSTVLSSLPQKPDGSRYFTMRVDASNSTKYADVICGVTKLKVQFNLEGGLNGSIYQIFQGSNQIDSARIAAGDSYLYTYETYDPTPVYVFSQAGENSLQGDGMWYFVPGAVSGSASTSTTPSAASSNPPVVNVPTPNDGAGSISGGDTGDNAVFQTVENPGGAGLTDAAYKQGVNEIVRAIRGSGGSGGGGSTDVSGIESRLDDVKANTKKSGDHAEAVGVMIADANADTGPGGKVTSGNAGGKGSAMGTTVKDNGEAVALSMETAVSNAMSSFTPSAPSAVTAPSAAESDTIEIQVRPGQVISIPKNPLSASGPFGGVLHDMAGFVKKLVAWGIVAAFVIWAHKRLQEMIEAPFNVAPFGSSITDSVNSVKVAGFGGGFGMLARVAAGAVILPVLLTIPLAATTALTAGLPWGEVKTVFSAGVGALPSSGMLAKAFWLSDQVIPWVTLLAAPVWYFTVQYVLFPSKIFWMIFMKYVSL